MKNTTTNIGEALVQSTLCLQTNTRMIPTNEYLYKHKMATITPTDEAYSHKMCSISGTFAGILMGATP